MTGDEMVRKRAFKKALIDAGMTQRAWCAAAGISVRHLNRVLVDPRQSAPLTQKILDFIAEGETPASTATAA
jgi:hypothetical protein